MLHHSATGSSNTTTTTTVTSATATTARVAAVLSATASTTSASATTGWIPMRKHRSSTVHPSLSATATNRPNATTVASEPLSEQSRQALSTLTGAKVTSGLMGARPLQQQQQQRQQDSKNPFLDVPPSRKVTKLQSGTFSKPQASRPPSMTSQPHQNKQQGQRLNLTRVRPSNTNTATQSTPSAAAKDSDGFRIPVSKPTTFSSSYSTNGAPTAKLAPKADYTNFLKRSTLTTKNHPNTTLAAILPASVHEESSAGEESESDRRDDNLPLSPRKSVSSKAMAFARRSIMHHATTAPEDVFRKVDQVAQSHHGEPSLMDLLMATLDAEEDPQQHHQHHQHHHLQEQHQNHHRRQDSLESVLRHQQQQQQSHVSKSFAPPGSKFTFESTLPAATTTTTTTRSVLASDSEVEPLSARRFSKSVLDLSSTTGGELVSSMRRTVNGQGAVPLDSARNDHDREAPEDTSQRTTGFDLRSALRRDSSRSQFELPNLIASFEPRLTLSTSRAGGSAPYKVPTVNEREAFRSSRMPRFRARPLDPKVFTSAGDLGVPRIRKQPVTVPVSPKFSKPRPRIHSTATTTTAIGASSVKRRNGIRGGGPVQSAAFKRRTDRTMPKAVGRIGVQSRDQPGQEPQQVARVERIVSSNPHNAQSALRVETEAEQDADGTESRNDHRLGSSTWTTPLSVPDVNQTRQPLMDASDEHGRGMEKQASSRVSLSNRSSLEQRTSATLRLSDAVEAEVNRMSVWGPPQRSDDQQDPPAPQHDFSWNRPAALATHDTTAHDHHAELGSRTTFLKRPLTQPMPFKFATTELLRKRTLFQPTRSSEAAAAASNKVPSFGGSRAGMGVAKRTAQPYQKRITTVVPFELATQRRAEMRPPPRQPEIRTLQSPSRLAGLRPLTFSRPVKTPQFGPHQTSTPTLYNSISFRLSQRRPPPTIPVSPKLGRQPGVRTIHWPMALLPKKSTKELTQPRSFRSWLDKRAHERELFDHLMEARHLQQQQQHSQGDEQQQRLRRVQEKEEAERRAYRAGPIRHYQPTMIHRATKPLTQPVSPMIGEKRKRYEMEKMERQVHEEQERWERMKGGKEQGQQQWHQDNEPRYHEQEPVELETEDPEARRLMEEQQALRMELARQERRQLDLANSDHATLRQPPIRVSLGVHEGEQAVAADDGVQEQESRRSSDSRTGPANNRLSKDLRRISLEASRRRSSGGGSGGRLSDPLARSSPGKDDKDRRASQEQYFPFSRSLTPTFVPAGSGGASAATITTTTTTIATAAAPPPQVNQELDKEDRRRSGSFIPLDLPSAHQQHPQQQKPPPAPAPPSRVLPRPTGLFRPTLHSSAPTYNRAQSKSSGLFGPMSRPMVANSHTMTTASSSTTATTSSTITTVIKTMAMASMMEPGETFVEEEVEEDRVAMDQRRGVGGVEDGLPSLSASRLKASHGPVVIDDTLTIDDL